MTAVDPDALTLTGISKRFGHARVLDDVTFHVRHGTVHALLGENGAGKTTLMRVAFGMVRPDDGGIRVDGRPLRIDSPADAIAAGIGMVHQHFTLVPAITVAENIALGGRGIFHPRIADERVREIAARTGFALDPAARVESLPVGAQQRIEIAKALARRARVLVLDEPTAVLAPAETDELLHWLRTFVAAGGAAVLITHKLHEALAVADDVTVLRRGRVAHTGPVAGASVDSLTAAMLGGDLARTTAPVAVARTEAGPPLFHAERLFLHDAHGRTRIRDARFVVCRREIVGVVGVEGAGQRELLRALAGRMEIASGTLTRPSRIGFVPEDRHHDAVLLDRPLVENVALRGAGERRGRMSWAALRAQTTALVRTFDVRAASVHAALRTLSGGNQQKLVLAREMGEHGDESALVIENPTRGLDVRASADVHERLRLARDRGAAIILYSSDLDEVLALASRVLVVYDGVVREVGLDRDTVGRAMLGIG